MIGYLHNQMEKAMNETNEVWEVQENNFCGGWTNNWSDHVKPLTFVSEQAAQEELDSYIEDVKDAVDNGDMACEVDPDNFRIVQIT